MEAAFAPVRSPRPFGMSDIVGNAMGFAQRPEEAEFAARRATFSLRPLLDQDRNAAMLIVNGADDVHVPQHDTLVFEGPRLIVRCPREMPSWHVGKNRPPTGQQRQRIAGVVRKTAIAEVGLADEPDKVESLLRRIRAPR